MTKVYSSKSCMKCLMMKRILEEIGEKYEEINIEDLNEDDLNIIVDNVSGVKSLPIVFYKNTWYGGNAYNSLKNELLGRKVK